MFGYNTNDLYIGGVGIVSHDDTHYRIDKIQYYIAFRKKEVLCEENKAIDILTDKEYNYLHDTKYCDTLRKSVGTYVVGNYAPIENFMSEPKRKIKEKDLLQLLDKLNNPEKYEQKAVEKQESKEEVKDAILQTIIDTNELVKKSKISDELKQSLHSELTKMADDYANEMISYHKSSESSPFQSEFEIRIKYVRMIANIESVCNDANNQKVYSISKQLETVKEELNK